MSDQFDTLAAAYAAFAAMPFREHLEAHSVFATLGDLRGLRVLDFGCGAGSYTRWLKARGAAFVAGVDRSDGMIAHARAREAEAPMGIEYYLGELPAALAGTFDIVLAVYVLPYATTREALQSMCAALARALRPGGRCVTLPVNPDFHPDPDQYARYGFRLFGERPLRDGDEITLEFCPTGHRALIAARYWSRAAIDEALRASGFSNIRWMHPTVSPEGVAAYGRDHWIAYLDAPHALLVEAHTQGLFERLRTVEPRRTGARQTRSHP